MKGVKWAVTHGAAGGYECRQACSDSDAVAQHRGQMEQTQTHQLQQRALAASARPDERRHGAAVDLEGEVTQDDLLLAAGVGECHVAAGRRAGGGGGGRQQAGRRRTGQQ